MAIGYNPSVVSAGLVFCLDSANQKSYSGSGTSWIDLSGNQSTGTLINSPSYNNGLLSFNGSNQYCSFGALNGSFSSFTVTVWFYPTVVANYNNVLDCSLYGSGNVGPRLEMNSVGTLGWVYSNNTSDNNSFYFHNVVNNNLSPNTWHCVSISYNGQNNTSATYYNENNTRIARSLNGSASGFIGSMNNVNIGRGFYNSRYFQGTLGYVAIYNTALSDSNIAQNFNALRRRFGI